MKNMKISMKLITGFLTVIVLSVIVGATGILGMYMINSADDAMYEGNYLPTVMAGDISQTVVSQRVIMRNFVIFDVNADATEFKSAESSLASSKTQMEALMAEYKGTIVNPEDQAAFDEFSKVYSSEWIPALDEVYSLGLANRTEEAKVALTAASTVASRMDELTTRLQDINLSDGQTTVNGNTALFLTMTIAEALVLLVAVAIAVFLALYISKLISVPVKKMVAAANAIAIGDMNVDVAYTSKDEIGVMANAFEKMVEGINEQVDVVQTLADGDLTCDVAIHCDRDKMGIALSKLVTNLNSMFGEINSSTAQVSTGSKQIADGAQSLAQGSTEQAAAVEQLSSSISEIAEKTRTNAEMASKAASLANTIKGNAEKGSRQMGEMMSAVKDINQASQSINKVIKVIDDIAFQTNILALNAAVEAARAGQHGKGFAVVAEEVRNLAAKSAEAAKDTGGLIANSMEKAELGARIADETSASLVEIVSGINESSQLVGDIARSSDEQSNGISQINKGIDQVAQVIQQNSATAQESAAASEEMSGQADMLENLVAQFKLKDDGMSRRLLSSAPPTPKAAPSRSQSFHSGDGGDYGKY